MGVGFASFRNTLVTVVAILRGEKWGFPVVKEVEKEASLGSHSASAKMLLSICALRLHAAAVAETPGLWKCSWSYNSPGA